MGIYKTNTFLRKVPSKNGDLQKFSRLEFGLFKVDVSKNENF